MEIKFCFTIGSEKPKILSDIQLAKQKETFAQIRKEIYPESIRVSDSKPSNQTSTSGGFHGN